MTLRSPRLAAAACAALVLAAPATADEVPAQPGHEVGDRNAEMLRMPEGDGRERTFLVCSSCHLIQVATAQRLSRQQWETLLTFMVEEAGMPPLDAEGYQTVLEYLSANFGPDAP